MYKADISEPDGNHKAKIYSKYTKIMRLESNCSTKESHQTTRKESKRRKEERITTKQPENS